MCVSVGIYIYIYISGYKKLPVGVTSGERNTIEEEHLGELHLCLQTSMSNYKSVWW